MTRPTIVHPVQKPIGVLKMNDLLEIIQDLEMVSALQGVYREAHIDDLLEKYTQRFKDIEADMERQSAFDFAA